MRDGLPGKRLSHIVYSHGHMGDYNGVRDWLADAEAVKCYRRDGDISRHGITRKHSNVLSAPLPRTTDEGLHVRSCALDAPAAQAHSIAAEAGQKLLQALRAIGQARAVHRWPESRCNAPPATAVTWAKVMRDNPPTRRLRACEHIRHTRSSLANVAAGSAPAAAAEHLA